MLGMRRGRLAAARRAPGGLSEAVAGGGGVGAGVSQAAAITSTKAKLWITMPSGSLGIGSPKTRMPPAIAETLAPAAVRVITGTASPFWSPRAEAKNAITDASTQVTSQGESRPAA